MNRLIHSHLYTLVAVLWLLTLGVFSGCKESGSADLGHSVQKSKSTETEKSHKPPAPSPDCPKFDVHKGMFPRVSAQHQQSAYWISRWRDEQLDTPLLSGAEIARHNLAMGKNPSAPTLQWNLLRPMPPEELHPQLQKRLATMSDQTHGGHLVQRDKSPLPSPLRRFFTLEAGVLRSETQSPVFEVAISPIQMRCAPYDGPLYRKESDNAFDQNACSSIHEQEPYEILGIWKNGMRFVRTRYAFGFIASETTHSAPIPSSYQAAYMQSVPMLADAPTEVQCGRAALTLPPHTQVPRTTDGRLIVANETEFCTISPPASFYSAGRTLTRRSFYHTVFQYLGRQYGYGGSENGLDCSRFVMDVLASFNLALPRNSYHQSLAGAYSLDVSQVRDVRQKEAYLDDAAQNGIVLLYFPGHIMFYLGRDKAGVPMAIHSLGEYAAPCDSSQSNEQPDETVFRVKKVVVTDLSLGGGSSRKSFIERLTRIVVLGNPSLSPRHAAVQYRPAAPPRYPFAPIQKWVGHTSPPRIWTEEECNDSVNLRIFQSPRRLIVGESARLIATGKTPFHSAMLQIFDRNGNAVPSTTHPLGGPPHTYWTEFIPEISGKYTIVLGDGDQIFACDQFGVGQYRSKKKPRATPEAYWRTRWKWEADTEALYSAFIEQLFNFPSESEISWNGLQSLLSDADHNLLFNHLGQNEDEELQLKPDCADLPYFLRAYFAWKTGLPFGVRSCSRGRKNRPPSCTDFQTNDMDAPFEETLDSEAKIFEQFANVVIGWNAHSASGRTHPKSNDSDYYPIPLERDALSPGTIYADPYGHILILTQWIPQPLGGEGKLMAADGQPDGTIGRRRFWQGSFLFDADTHSYGAGFKKFRPIVYEQQETDDGLQMVPITLENRDLARSRQFTRYSLEQYEKGADVFYDKIQQLINPSPLDPEAIIKSRVDALHETVRRRVTAVDNGEAYMTAHQFRMIEMPEGIDIFQTEGPWEDYATPSRDMRLLISIDSVLEVPRKVSQNPKQYGITDTSEITRIISHLKEVLDATLAQKTIEYDRSDGSKWTLTLEDIVARRKHFEMAYNPNDCVEKRWGAPVNSDEFRPCRRNAPAEQEQQMGRYRSWFSSRKRPQRQ